MNNTIGISQNISQTSITDLIAKARSLAILIWNVSHGVSKNMILFTAPTIILALTDEIGAEEAQKLADRMDWSVLENTMEQYKIL